MEPWSIKSDANFEDSLHSTSVVILPNYKVYELNPLLTTVGRLAAAQLSRGAVCPTVPLHYSCSAECSVCSAQSQLAH